MICVLDNGRIAEQGRHQQLMAKKGLYYRLNSAQLGIIPEENGRKKRSARKTKKRASRRASPVSAE